MIKLSSARVPFFWEYVRVALKEFPVLTWPVNDFIEMLGAVPLLSLLHPNAKKHIKNRRGSFDFMNMIWTAQIKEFSRKALVLYRLTYYLTFHSAKS
jgi:hypothetical protein